MTHGPLNAKFFECVIS